MAWKSIAEAEAEALASGSYFAREETRNGSTLYQNWILKSGIRRFPFLHGPDDAPAVVAIDLRTGNTLRKEWRWRRLHRDSGPARILMEGTTGAVRQEDWFWNGFLHRKHEDGPARTKYNPFTGAVTYEAFYEKGKKISERSYPENEAAPTPRMIASRARWARAKRAKAMPS